MSKEHSAGEWIIILILAIIGVIALVLFAGWIVWLLWPVAITLGLPALTYWESVGLLLLSSMLLKSVTYKT
jgi:hypothetical protein